MFNFQKTLNKDDWPILRKFISKSYRKDHPLLNKNFFNWQFRVKKKINFFCLKQNNKIICAMGYINIPMRIKKRNIVCKWLLHWISDKKFIGSGAYLLRKIEKNYKNIFTMNASPSGKSFYTRKKNWHGIDPIRRNIIVFQSKEANKLVINKKYQKIVSEFLFNRDYLIKQVNLKKFNIKKYNPNWSYYPELSNFALRNKSFLKWRYLQHPQFKYNIFSVGSDNRPAICIYRIEKLQGKVQGKIARIVDFFFPKNKSGYKDAFFLMQNILSYLNLKNCILVDFYSNSKKYSKLFNSFSKDKNKNEKIFISKFSPIKKENYDLNIYYKLDPKLRFKIKDLYISKSDIDGDGPVRLN